MFGKATSMGRLAKMMKKSPERMYGSNKTLDEGFECSSKTFDDFASSARYWIGDDAQMIKRLGRSNFSFKRRFKKS